MIYTKSVIINYFFQCFILATAASEQDWSANL